MVHRHGQHTYYPAGQMSAAVALAYDLLYDDLTEAERSLVRRALPIENAIIPVYKEYVLDNRVSANPTIGCRARGWWSSDSSEIGDRGRCKA